MSSRWKKIRHRIELAGAKFLLILPRLLPYRTAVRFGGFFGVLAFDLVRIRRRVTLENLERAFGDRLDDRDRVRIGRASYVNFAKSMVEMASLPRLSRQRLRELVMFVDAVNLDDALADKKGVMIVTGHFGSWELLGAASVAYGYPSAFLVGEQSNRLVDNLINDLRTGAGIEIIARGIAARGVFEYLKKNYLVAMLSDQDAKRAGIFVDFFGIPASTYPGAAQFSYRSGCPIVCCYIVRQKNETHRAFFLPAIRPEPGAAKAEEVERMTAAYTKAIEDFASLYPEQYFWAHRRWKSKPPEG
jgi:KDO2-lipid IV(A) lauroyltransferase